MSATTTQTAQMIMIVFRGEKIAARRPTHGEIDLAWLERRLGILFGAKKGVVDEVAKGGDGVSDRIDRCLVVASDAGHALCKRLSVLTGVLADGSTSADNRVALNGIGVTMLAGDEDRRTAAAVDFGQALLAALEVTEAGLGKS